MVSETFGRTKCTFPPLHIQKHLFVEPCVVYLCSGTFAGLVTVEHPLALMYPAAVMSFVVKLLFAFNIVYRDQHLLEATVIYPYSSDVLSLWCALASIQSSAAQG